MMRSHPMMRMLLPLAAVAVTVTLTAGLFS